jgi:hypothetical protein
MVEGIADRPEMVGGDVEIHAGRLDAAVAEQRLDGAEIGVVLKEMGREGMPEGVRRDRLSDAGFESGGGDEPLDGAARERTIGQGAGEEPGLRLDEAGTPVVAEQQEEALAELDLTVFPSFALPDADEHGFAIDVGHLQVDQLAET